jgi:hypothetical protein
VGTIDLALTQLAPTPPSSGEGALAFVTFRAVSTGTSAIDFSSVILANSEGMQIPADEVGGMVEVGGGKYEIYLPIVQR